MAYTVQNFKTKKAFKAAVGSQIVRAYQPGPFGPDLADGEHCFQGPHYPEPHRWAATATVEDGIVVRVKS